MKNEEDPVKRQQIVDARARNISHNVRCLECGSQSIEESQADIAVLLRKLIRDEIRSGKSDKDIYKKLEDDYGETILYAPKFDWQTAAFWLSPLLIAGAAGGIWAYSRHRQRTNVHLLALNLTRGVPLTPKEGNHARHPESSSISRNSSFIPMVETMASSVNKLHWFRSCSQVTR